MFDGFHNCILGVVQFLLVDCLGYVHDVFYGVRVVLPECEELEVEFEDGLKEEAGVAVAVGVVKLAV
jgi:hypothetical protein